MICVAETTLEGLVMRVLFRNPESLYTVARLQTSHGEVTATGPFLEIAEGDRLQLEGEWTHHPKWGRQFGVRGHKKLLPDTVSGMEAYLSGGLFKGIGKKLARRIVQHFGEATLETLLQEPERVLEVPGIGASKRETLVDSLREYGRVQGLVMFLQGHGLSLGLTMKIYQRYGESALHVVKSNPYRLAEEVEGIGFLTADEIARKLGTDPAAPGRLKASVQHVLSERGESDGHVFLPQSELVARLLEFLNRGQTGQPVRAPQIQAALDDLVEQGFLVRDQGGAIYRREAYEAEVGLAERIRALSDRPVPEVADADRLIAEVEAALGVTYAPEQRKAVGTALGSPLCVITGGPGTGKSTVLLGVLTALRKLEPEAQVLLAAPTGRAARRMTEVTGEPARTIHRLLGYNPQENAFLVDEYDPLRGHVLVVDEFSMVDLNLAAALFNGVPDHMRVLVVGDADQLPSVGMGNVLADLLASGAVPVVRLTRVYRQAAESRIVLNAHRINAGQMPDLGTAPDFEFVRRENPADLARYIRERALSARDAGATLDKITVLTPMRKTETGVEALNKALQEALNPARRGRPELQAGTAVFRLGDKVMQRKNNYEKEVFNGSVGVVTAVRESGDKGEALTVTFEDDQKVEYKREELDQLTLAYACTVHKSQGSEYAGLVMIPVTTQHHAMLQRNLLYTALTRAKEKAVLVGTEEALARAVRNNRITRRHSRLAQRLRGEFTRIALPPMPVAEARDQSAPRAAALYVAVAGRGWAAVRVLADSTRTEWSGARAGVSPDRLRATALGLALHDLEPGLAVVVCSPDQAFLDALERGAPGSEELEQVRALLGERVWRGACVGPNDAMASECERLAREAASLPRVLSLLQNTSPRVRLAALNELEQMGPDESCLEPLNDLLQREKQKGIRKLAESMLRKLLK